MKLYHHLRAALGVKLFYAAPHQPFYGLGRHRQFATHQLLSQMQCQPLERLRHALTGLGQFH